MQRNKEEKWKRKQLTIKIIEIGKHARRNQERRQKKHPSVRSVVYVKTPSEHANSYEVKSVNCLLSK
jgi:hypothetical protein